MGRTHALSGAFTGLALGPWWGWDTYAEVLPFAAVVAGFALAAGGLCWVSTHLLGLVALAVWVGFGLLLAHDRLGRLALVAFGLGPLLALAAGAETGLVPALSTVSASLQDGLPIAVLLGCLAHDVGDAITEGGCPILWPLPIAGETWFELRPPSFLRFRTGGVAEQWVIVPALTVGCVLALTGLAPILADQLPGVLHAAAR